MTCSPASHKARIAAFRAEAAALHGVADAATGAELARPSPCPPWTNAALLCHVAIAVGRVGPAIEAGLAPAGPGTARDQLATAPGTARDRLVTAPGYYRPDQRFFSAGVNADRVDVAATLAARLGSAAAIAAELATAGQQSLALLSATPPDQVVRTRHGDLMLLSEFTVTRVVELAVHALDLAAGLGRQPWLTGEAAAVLEDLLLPAPSDQPGQVSAQRAAEALAARLGCDRAGLIARLTGRKPLSAAETAMLTEHGAVRLVLG